MADSIKRMHYFNGLLLKETEFNLEQSYYRKMRYLHNRYFHTPGVIWGLDLTGSNYLLKVGEGIALLDKAGFDDKDEEQDCEIVMASAKTIDLTSYSNSGGVYVAVANKQELVEKDETDTGYKYYQTEGIIKIAKDKTQLANTVLLGKVIFKEGGIQEILYQEADGTPIRTYAGAAGKLTLPVNGKETPAYIEGKTFDTGTTGIQVNSPQTHFAGSLSLDGDLTMVKNKGRTKANLEVEGTVKATQFEGDGSRLKGINASKWTGGSGNSVYYNGGNVGIGLTDPVKAKLEVTGMVGRTVAIFNRIQGISLVAHWPNIGFNGYFDTAWKSLSAGFAGCISLNPDNGSLSLSTGTKSTAADQAVTMTERLVIDSAGIVRLGSAAQNCKLEVNGDTWITDKNIYLRGITDQNHGIGWFGAGKMFANFNLDGPVVFGFSGGMLGTTKNGQKSALYWNDNGNVGIGSTAPAKAKLEVEGKVGNTVAIFSRDQGISLVAHWPNIGFNGYFDTAWKSLSAGFAGCISLNPDNGSLSLSTGAKSTAADQAVTMTERLVIDSAGIVRLGSAAQNCKLEVNGDTWITDKNIYLRGTTDQNHGIGWFGAGKLFANFNLDGPVVFGFSGGILGTAKNGQKAALYWNDSGNVGIGKAPSDKLDVAGNIKISGTLGTNGIAPTPRTPGWGGGIHTWDIEAEGTIWSRNGLQQGNRDYAEYFESLDGKEIPPGTAVVLDGNKIRPAKKEETPFGIISAAPGVVGGAYRDWPNKYLKDDYGNPLMEEYQEELLTPKLEKIAKEKPKLEKKIINEEVARIEIVLQKGKYCKREVVEQVTREIEEPLFEEVDLYDATGSKKIGKHQVPIMETREEENVIIDDDGKPVMIGTGKFITKKRPKLNPKYDEAKEYIIREQRPEWNCVGLLGQLPLRKGQSVAPNWIKIENISKEVDLWLVK